MTCSEANFNRLISFFFFLEMYEFVEATRLFKFTSVSLRKIMCFDILMPRLALILLQIEVVAYRSFFSLPIILSSLSVVFLDVPGGYWASHDPVSSSFLKILWITLLDFLTVFEIFPVVSPPSLCNLTISFVSSNDVTDFIAKRWCNLVKYHILYSYPPKIFNNTK